MDTLTDGESYFDASFSKLASADLQLKNSEFEECRFEDCDFSGAEFRNCKFTNCEFERCNLSLVSLPNTKVFGMTFTECKLVGVDWTKVTWPMFHVDFELTFRRCIMNDNSFYGLTLHELVLDECKLHDVDFREGKFPDSTMTYCDFTNSLFIRTNLQQVDFSESSNYMINVLENQVKGAKFTRFEALSLLECLGIELVD